MALTPIVTVSATTKGGRDGRAVLAGGGMGLAMALPKELGGSGEGMNPEQLFALGYSSCFGQAVLVAAKNHGVDGGAARVTADVTLNKDDGGFALSVVLTVAIPGVERDKVEAVAHAAHQLCPYSKATRGNIPVEIKVA